MRAIVVGSGAGGATLARELQSNGIEVSIFEAGGSFKPFTRHLSWADPLRRLGIMNETRFQNLFPAMDIQRSSSELLLVRGLTSGGCTVLSCGNLVRTDRGLKEIGLDLNNEFDELENELNPITIPMDEWRPITQKMYHTAESMGLNPKPTPKAMQLKKCDFCGLCELGCHKAARWDSRKFLNQAIKKGSILNTKSPVEKVIVENGKVSGVICKNKAFKADLVILSAGGIGTAQIIKRSGLKADDALWADIVLTLGGVYKNAKQLLEPPMAWYTKHEDFILSPYPDILSHWFHKPWRKVAIDDRVGLMVKLADFESGVVAEDGTVNKKLTELDQERLSSAVEIASDIMRDSGVNGQLTEGLANGGHFGGTVPLAKEDVNNMRPSWLPEGLWVADLSLVPKSQGMPTILLTAALALKVARIIIKNTEKS